MKKPFFRFADKAATTSATRSSGGASTRSAGEPAQAVSRQSPARPATTPPPRASAQAGIAGRRSAAAPAGMAPAAAGSAGRAGGGHALMIGVFALSALIGGGLAGLFLAMQDAAKPAGGNASGNTSIAIIAPKTPGGSAALPAASGADDTKAAGKAQDARVAAAATGAADKAAPGKPASTASNEGGGESGASADAAELQQLTEQVVSALGALGRAEQEGTIEEAAASADNLRGSLANLVDAAIASGKSDEEIRALVTEALNNAGEDNIPAMLRDAAGKLDVHRLLASVMPAAPADAMPMSSDEREYFNQLQEEAGDVAATTPSAVARRDANTGSKRTNDKRTSGRFFVRGGKRYTIIRRGDTLSDIAYAAYGDVLAYAAILRANRGRISVRNLKPGTRILIPDITTTRNKNRKRAVHRRQGAVPAASRQRTAGGTTQPHNRPPRTAGKRDEAPADSQRIITLPAADNVAVKITNFRAARSPRPQ